jgi:hypothetical protein
MGAKFILLRRAASAHDSMGQILPIRLMARAPRSRSTLCRSRYRARRRCTGRDAVSAVARMASARRKTASIVIEALSSPGGSFTSNTAWRASGSRKPMEVSARMASSTRERRSLAPCIDIDAGSLLAGEVVMPSGRDDRALSVRSSGGDFIRDLSRCS